MNQNGRARPPGAPGPPQRKQLPHDRPLWVRTEDEIFFITVCCEPRGKNQLCYPKIARAIFDSVEFRNRSRVWYARLVCLMPDHLHALISFPYERPMKQIIADWKRFLARALKIEWQRDFFDHRLRRDESHHEKADYIRANPVRAGLVTASEAWPYFWQADPQEQGANREGAAQRPVAPGGRALPLLLALALLFAACRTDMNNQPKAKPLSESDFFSNQANARPIPPHTVERGDARENAALYTGLTNGIYITQLPVTLTPELLSRGRKRSAARLFAAAHTCGLRRRPQLAHMQRCYALPPPSRAETAAAPARRAAGAPGVSLSRRSVPMPMPAPIEGASGGSGDGEIGQCADETYRGDADAGPNRRLAAVRRHDGAMRPFRRAGAQKINAAVGADRSSNHGRSGAQ